jgi:hypothetical protein
MRFARPFKWTLATALVTVFHASPACAEIALSPLRQVITPSAPVATYEVSNPSTRTVEGRVSWLDLTATETGYAPAAPEERTARSAAPYLTLWPASFRLEPGASAKIFVKLKNGGAAPKGERRSHLLIETEAVRTPLRKIGGSLELDIGLGVSTPVILRVGPPRAAAHFGDTRLLRGSDGLLELETHLHPDGPSTAYGRIEALVVGADGVKTRFGLVENVAVYPEATRRRFVLPLKVDALPAGVMELRFDGRAEFEGVRFASRSFEIAAAR